MRELIAKYRKRRPQSKVLKTNLELERTVRRLGRKLKKSVAKWHPSQHQKTDYLARATLTMAVDYVQSANQLFNRRGGHSLSQGLDLVRTALEHAYVLAILAQERDEGTAFVLNWAQRMQAKRLKRLVDAPYGDDEDKRSISVQLADVLAEVGQKFAKPTVDELVARANLRIVHSFTYGLLSPYSHFDLTKTLEAAYEREADLPKDIEVSIYERRCEALHNLLSVMLYLAIARRDFGDASIAEEVEKSGAVFRNTQATAFQVAEDLA